MTRTVIERFVEHSPITVMARLALQRALDPEWIDGLFEQVQVDKGQHVRESLFSATVELMSMIASGLRYTVRAAAGAAPELPVAITALHDRISRTRPGWARVLARESVKRLSPLVQPLMFNRPVTASGYRLRIVDGSHLPKGEKCSPGPSGCVHTLMPQAGLGVGVRTVVPFVVYDPEVAMIVDLVPCEQGRAQEEVNAGALLDSVQPGELWIIDRNFSTHAIVTGWQRRSSAFIVQERGCNPNQIEAGRPVRKGRIEMGAVYEQPVSTTDDSGASLVLRRIEVRANGSSVEGGEVIRILTNVPASQLTAEEVASLSCRSWSEMLSVPLELVLKGEILSLGRPRAAPLALGMAALAYNVLSTMVRTVSREQELDTREVQRLPHYIATGIRATYAGVMIAVPAEFWRRYDQLAPGDLGDILRKIAAHVDPRSAHKQRREPTASPETKAILRAATLDVMFRREEGEDPDNEPLSGQRFIAMATREFSSNPSKVLRDTAESPVMVTKYGQAIAFLISVEDWNRMKAERRENILDRLAAEHAGPQSAGRGPAREPSIN
ncbi:hypothetical protein EOS_17840 [Caballeronia mineralivorans PML1(12)]|uniref:Prevent-host-death protein n=1 Tax=Caballeronia mineralivorans PML1(12) TaxID=908627 RepID=A0A0J1CWA6_9BURK|nr:type II toxin-antitoxin system Phd/YefM family antitoxin [Caballeronia mineralivorans]KLU24860.1 hypothetical protein EOS_17840 [Caballeronia mineralivorans PML1(12)]